MNNPWEESDDADERDSAEYRKYEEEMEQEWRREASREDLLKEIDRLRAEQHRLYALAQRCDRFEGYFHSEECGAVTPRNKADPWSGVMRAIEIAEVAVRKERLERNMESHFCETWPELVAAISAYRRGQFYTKDWPAEAQQHYKRNRLAAEMSHLFVHGGTTRETIRGMERLAALFDATTDAVSDLFSVKDVELPDGEKAYQEGRAAPWEHDIHYPKNPHRRDTYLHAMFEAGVRDIKNERDSISFRRVAEQAAAERLKQLLTDDAYIEITGKTPAAEPNLPSHFFPGCGSDFGTFRLVGGVADRIDIAAVIERAATDPVQVNSFDPETGLGSFAVVDGDAPEPGTIIPWKDPEGDGDSREREAAEEGPEIEWPGDAALPAARGLIARVKDALGMSTR